MPQHVRQKWKTCNQGKPLTNRTFQIIISVVKHECFSATTDSIEWLWHLRFGHLNFKDLSKLRKCTMVNGLPHVNVPETVCKECIECKQSRGNFNTFLPTKSATVLEIIHSNVCGPNEITTLVGNKYYVVFIDDWQQILSP